MTIFAFVLFVCVVIVLFRIELIRYKLSGAICKTFSSGIYLTEESGDHFKKVAEDYVNKNSEAILKKYEEEVKLKITDDYFIDRLCKDVLRPAKRELQEKVSEQLIEKHLPEIIREVDVKTISNAVLLGITGKVLNNNGEH